MIKNREELLSLSSEWAAMAKNDLRAQAINFMETMGTNEEELAYALGISMGELMQILEGNGEVSLSTFAKILIATDNVIEIKPLAAMGMRNMPAPRQGGRQMGGMPQGEMRRDGAPQGGGMPQGERFGGMPGMGRRAPMDANGRPMTPPMDRNGRPMTPPMDRNGRPMMPPMDRNGRPMMPPMDANGRPMMPPMDGMPQGERFGGMPGMGRRAPQEAPQRASRRPEENGFGLNRSQLIGELRKNFWDTEVDVNQMSDKDLHDFLMMKSNPQPQAQNPCNEVRCENTQRTNAQKVNIQGVDPTDEFMSLLSKALEQNPHLGEEIAKYLPRS